jgi:hypothetical protein
LLIFCIRMTVMRRLTVKLNEQETLFVMTKAIL